MYVYGPSLQANYSASLWERRPQCHITTVSVSVGRETVRQSGVSGHPLQIQLFQLAPEIGWCRKLLGSGVSWTPQLLRETRDLFIEHCVIVQTSRLHCTLTCTQKNGCVSSMCILQNWEHSCAFHTRTHTHTETHQFTRRCTTRQSTAQKNVFAQHLK